MGHRSKVQANSRSWNPLSCSYDKPPLDDITIEEFETPALDRLRVLAEIESCYARNRTFKEMESVILGNVCGKYLELSRTTNQYKSLDAERRKDHIGHFVLRLAFCRSCVGVSLVRLPGLTSFGWDV